MLRAVRFAAKLDFTLAPETAAPIAYLGHLLKDVPSARLFDELLKLFQSGHAVRSFELLVQYDLLRYLFRDTQALLETQERAKIVDFIRRGLANTDQRVREDKPVTPMFLYALFLWFPIQSLARRLEGEGWNDGQAMLEASQRIVATQQTAFPRRFSSPMKELLSMQWRFGQKGSRAARLLQHKRFRAAYDFLVLRGSCGEVEQATVDWWTELQTMPPEEQAKVLNAGNRRSGRRRRGGRRRGGRNNEMNDVVV
jgi:poly(A) polymerase